jgi:uncharacterized protein YfaS (alpha-2-macroglobulin family)
MEADPMDHRLRPYLRFFVLALVVAVAACFPGARAPNVPPQRTLGLNAAEVEARGSSAAFGVVFAGPKGEVVDPSEVSIVFNRPMRPLELASDTEETAPPATIAIKGGGAVPAGKWRWLGTSALMFAPEKALPRATEWVVNVPGATKALDGSVLGKDYGFSFTTQRPQVVHFTPGDGANHLEPKQTFELRFNQPVDPKEVERATKMSAFGGKTSIAFTASRPKSDVPMLVKLTPKAPLPLAAPIVIAVDGTLRGLEGPLPAAAAREAHVETYGPLTVSEIGCSRTDKKLCAPHGSVNVELSNRVSLDDFKAHVRVEPAVPLKWIKGRDGSDKSQWYGLPVDLGPARSFRVVVTPGLKDEYGQTLAREHAVALRTDDESPSTLIGLSGTVFEAAKAKGREIPVSSLNVDRFELVSGTTDEVGLMKLLRTRSADAYGFARQMPGAKVEDVNLAGAPRNVVALRSVSTNALLGAKGKGLVFVGTSTPAGGARRPNVSLRHASVTDLAITAKLSRFGSLAFVTRLSDGKPVTGATVAVRDETGRETFTATTDGRGIALLPADRFQPVKPEGDMDERLVLFARAGDDWTYRAVNDNLAHADTPSLDMAARMPVFGMLFTDRGIYKAGETVRVKGVFRQNTAKSMDTPRGREITITAHDPEGGTMFEQKAKLGAFGELAVDIPIAATSRLGRMAIDAIANGDKKEPWESGAASTAVEIAAYRPAEFKVAVDPSQPSFIRGDKATFTVRGDYLFGAPMSGGKVRFNAMRSRTSFTPPGLGEGFEVDDDAYRWGLTDTSPRGGKLQGGDGALSEKGTFESVVGLTLPKQDGPENVIFDAEVEDLSRQTIAGGATALVHPAEFYLAIERPKDLFVSANTPLRAGVMAVEPSGTHRAGVGVRVELVSLTWATATESTGDEGFHYESRAVDKVVGTCETKTTATGAASCELRPAEAGFYIVRANGADKRNNPIAASYAVYVSGDSARVAWPVYDGSKLELVTDKKSYEVGDVAKILVKSPFKEAEALVTVERQGIQKEERSLVRGSMPTFSVPVTAEMWPNVYVSVALLKGRTTEPAAKKNKSADVGAPAYRIGWAEIVVNPESRRLKVDVKPSRKDLHPGDDIDVDLVVTDRAGKGSKADVAFYAVDEGVLMLTGYKTPDPLPVFSARRSLSVAPVESRDDLARIVRLGRGPGEDKGDEGGGGGEGPATRQDFRTTAFFQPSVLTGADGKAHVRFKLPDSLTTYRLMAVATSETDRFGFGQESVVTSRPLMARPALPRFLRAGDAIDAGIILTSKNLPAQTVEVKLDAKGVVVQGDRTQRVNLPANGAVEVRWAIGSPTAGKAELAFHAKGDAGPARDDVTVKREVEVPSSLEAVALYGDTETAIAERLGNLTGMRTDVGGLELSVASTALVGLDNGVEALMEYPYGCTEQLTSRMVPLVALGDLARDYNVKLPADTNAIVDDTVAKILKAQRSDGSFGYWIDSQRGDTWLTAYALWGLQLAHERGRPVPAAAIDGAMRWLRAKLSECGGVVDSPAKRKRAAPEPICNDGVTLAGHAFVIDVLAMTGHADAGYATRLFERREKLPLFARALLAHAMTLTKMRPEDARELLRDAEAHVRVTPTGATIAENLGDRYAPLLDSDNRTTAIVLRSLVTVDPKHALGARLAKGLLAARRGGAWRTTQENAWALLGLDAYRKAQEAEAPDFDALAFFGDQEVLKASFHGRSVKSQSASFPAEKIFGRAGQNLAFQVDGKGRLFYEARLRYARTTLPTTPLDRGFFIRKTIRSVKPEALGDAMRTLPQASASSANASDLVLVDLVVVTPDPREQVVIDDPLPAGLEPVQAKLATTARDLAVTEPGDEGDEGDAEEASDVDERAAGKTFQHSWYHREFHDDRVLTFVDRMAAGMYHYRYLARATTPGRFVVPPTRAECMYEPETFGRTAATTFEVKRSNPAKRGESAWGARGAEPLEREREVRR